MGEHLLLVEDDTALREVTALHLRSAGYRVEPAVDVASALAACEAARPRLVVLDLNLPDGDGLDVCRALRKRFAPSPGVLMVTARGEDADVVMGLDAGADDYVVKPFTPAVLLARVAALARRLDDHGGARPLRFERVAFDPRTQSATVDAHVLQLTPTELTLLTTLMKRPGVVHSRKQLLAEVFDTTHQSYARNVDCHVTRLRRKLEAAGLRPPPIYTVHGSGYRLGAA